MKSLTSIAYKALTAFMVVMLALTAMPVSPAYAAVSQPGAWTPQYSNAAYPAGAVNAAFAMPAGTNRLLVVAIASTRTSAGNQSVAVTYGGQALTLAAGDATSTGTWNHTYLYYLNNAGINAAVGSSLNVTITGGTSYYNWVYTAVFAGVDQTTPFTSARNYNSGNTANDDVGPFNPTLTIGANDQAIEIVNLARSANGNTTRSISTFAAGWTTAGVDQTRNQGGSEPTAHLYIRNRNVLTAANDGSQHTADSGNTWDSMTAMSIKAVPLTATTTTITSDLPDPSVVGQNVVVNFTVTAGATGNVTVSDGVNNCTGTVAAGTCTLALATAGARTLTAIYAGDANFNTSTSTGVAHTVNKADTTTTITNAAALGTASVVGQAYAVTYSVAAVAPGAGTPTGNVTVSDGTASNTCTVAAGTCNLTSTSVGAKTITATYVGDANFNTSTSTGVAHTVNKANTTATMTSDTPDPSSAGQAYTVGATVAANAPGSGTPTGTITVSDGTDTCTITLPATTCSLTSTTAGAKNLIATYNGDANFNASPASAGRAHTVNASFTITVTAGTGGTITPSGAPSGQVPVTSGSDQAFDIAPNDNFIVSNVIVGPPSVSQGRRNSYTFSNVTQNQTITASFNGGWSLPAGSANGGGGNWGNNITSGYTSNNSRTTSPFLAGSVDYFNFNIPAIPAGSTIDGIEVAIEGSTTGSNVNISISPSGTGPFATATAIPTTFTANAGEATDVLGSPSNSSVWGNTAAWNNASFTNANFRLRIASTVPLAGFSLDQVQVKVYYRQLTTLAVSAATGIYGGTVDLSATLATTVGSTPVSGQTINFYLNGNPTSPVGSAVTNASGVATLTGVNAASLAGINAGAYPGTYNTSGVGASFAGTTAGVLPGYLPSTAAANLTIGKATPVVTWNNPADIVYGTALGGTQLDATASVPGAFVYAPLAGTVLDAGLGQTLSVAFTPTDTTNYNSVPNTTVTINVLQATPTVTVSGGPFVYDGNPHAATVDVTGVGAVNVTGTMTVTYDGSATVPSDAGTYAVAVNFTSTDPNYTNATGSGSITIGQATPTVTVSGGPFVYDGNPHAATVDVTGVGAVNVTGTMTVTYDGSATVPSDAGTYAVAVNFTSTDPNYTNATGSGSITIGQATPVVTWNNPADIVYGTALGGTQLDATASVPGAFVYAPLAGTVLDAGLGQTLSVAFTPTDTTNYNSVPNTTVTINVLQATPTVTVSGGPFVYDGNPHAATVDVTGVGAVNVIGTMTVTYDGSATVPSDAGTYAVAVNFTSTDPNYTNATGSGSITIGQATPTVTVSGGPFVYDGNPHAATVDVTGVGAVNVTGTMTVTYDGSATVPSDAGTYAVAVNFTSTDPNYTNATGSGSITIGQATPTVTVSGGPFVYDGNPHAATVDVTGVGAVNVTGTMTVTYDGSATVPSDAGTYAVAVNFTSTDPNYTNATGSGSITIGQATPTVTVSGGPFVYDGNPHAATVDVTGVGAVNVTGTMTVTYDGSATVPSDAGTYAVAVNFTSTDPNYTNATGSGSITIAKRAITVTAVTDTKAYDGTTSSTGVPIITSGTLVLPDAFTLTQEFDTKDIGVNKTLSPVAVISVGNANNYIVTYVNNTTGAITGITMTVDNITANNKVYDGNTTASLNTGTAALVGVVSGDNVQLDVTGVAGTFANKDVGNGKTVTISGLTLTGADAANYAIILPTATANITTRPITVSAQTDTKAYDGNTSSAVIPLISTGTLAAGDTAGFTQTFATQNVGTSKLLTPSGAVNDGNGGGNYLVTFVNNTTGVITALPITVTADAKSKVFGGADPALTFSLTSGSLVGGDSLSGSLSRVPGEAVGSYAILQGSVSAGPNYNLTYVGANLTISIISQTITVVTSAPPIAAYNSNFNVTATASSGLPVAITTTGSTACTGSGSTTATIVVSSGTGTCTVHYNQAGNVNFVAAPEVLETTAPQKADQTILVSAPAVGATAIYNTSFNAAANATSTLTVTYSFAAGSVCTNIGANFTMTSGTGTCTVQYNQAGDNNYNAAPQVTRTVAALKASQSISVTTPAPGSAAYGSNFTVAATAPGGTVTYTSSGACTNALAVFTMTSGTGTCTVQYNQAGNANYNPVTPPVTQTVNATKAALNITASNESMTFGGTVPTITPIYAGFVAGDNASSLTTAPTCSTTATSASPVGSYPSSCNGAASDNYNITYTAGSVTVAASAATVSVTGGTFAYDGNPHAGTGFAYGSGGVGDVQTPAVTFSYSGTGATVYGPTATAPTNAGTYNVTASFAGNTNYAATSNTAAINITARDITITAADKSKALGAADPALTYTITSGTLVGGDTFSGTLTRVAGETVGSYAILQGSVSAGSNYNITYVGANLTIGIDSTVPSVTVNQATGQADPTNTATINFTVEFSEAVTDFTNTDIAIGGTAGANSAVISGTGPYNVAITGMTNDGTVTISIPANAVIDVGGNDNTASTSTDNTVTYFDGNGPNIQVVNTSPETTDHSLINAESVTFNISQFTVKFNQDVYNPAGDSDADDVTNSNNYLLIRDLGDTAGLQTVSCAGGAIVPADTKITTGAVTYDNATYTATFSVNGGLPLSNGDYHLFICGTTSIVDPLNNALALVGSSGLPNSDFRLSFAVNVTGNGGGGNNSGNNTTTTSSSLSTSKVQIPVTGFDPNKVTLLPAQPVNKAYMSLDDIRIEIPTLGINYSIVGVSLSKNNWDLTWLKDSVGYLEGSAYPTFNGNTVLTAHVKDANRNAGPFSDIKGMQLGDKIYIHAYGKTYVYEVQENKKISPNDISTAFKHQEYSWITLITCEDYNAKIEEYYHRRMVRAVLISVVSEK